MFYRMKNKFSEIICVSVLGLSIGIGSIIAVGFTPMILGHLNDDVVKSTYIIILVICSLMSLFACVIFSFMGEETQFVKNLFRIMKWDILLGLFVGCLIHGVFLPLRLFSIMPVVFTWELIVMCLIVVVLSLFGTVLLSAQSIISIKEYCLKNKEVEIES